MSSAFFNLLQMGAFNDFDDPQYYRVLFLNAPVGLAYVDKDGRFLRVNHKLCHITGYSMHEMEGGMTFQQITHPGDTDSDVRMVKKILSGELDTYSMTKRYITKSGKSIWVKLNVFPILGKNGQFRHFVSWVVPIPINGEAHRGKNGEIVVKTTFSSKQFFKENWKWILTILTGFIAAAATFIYKVLIFANKVMEELNIEW